ncbi:hypothetical protein Xind_01865 [Xenorhabdus indica]|nr:hypothetical protein [Xenorhabdus indica]
MTAIWYQTKPEPTGKLLGYSVYYTDEYRSELTRAGIGYVPFC